jgi:transposase
LSVSSTLSPADTGEARKEARNEFIRAVDARGLLNKAEIAEIVDLHRSTVSRIANREVTAGD